MSTIETVMQLGGAGGIAQVGTRILGMLSANRDAQRQADRDDREKWESIAKITKNVRGTGGAWVYRMFAITCVFVLVSPLVLPLFGDVTITWYVPKDGFNWFVLDRNKMNSYTFGDGGKHLALLPFQISFCSNVAWFYICGKPLKHKW